MNKIFVILTAGALAGCTAWQRPQPEPETAAPHLVTETSYGLSNLYEETSASQLYAVVAARATNKMLDQTTEIYERPARPKLYVMQIKKPVPVMCRMVFRIRAALPVRLLTAQKPLRWSINRKTPTTGSTLSSAA